MARFAFTEKSEQDLQAIVDYTRDRWGRLQAIRYLDGLEERAQVLADNPDLGVHRDTLEKGLRSFPYERHVLYYLKESYGITIVRVLHASMDPVRHL